MKQCRSAQAAAGENRFAVRLELAYVLVALASCLAQEAVAWSGMANPAGAQGPVHLARSVEVADRERAVLHAVTVGRERVIQIAVVVNLVQAVRAAVQTSAKARSFPLSPWPLGELPPRDQVEPLIAARSGGRDESLVRRSRSPCRAVGRALRTRSRAATCASSSTWWL